MIDYNDFNWLSDCIGYEIGFDNIDEIGLYAFKKYPNIIVYIDTATGNILGGKINVGIK